MKVLKNGRGPATPLMTPTEHRPYTGELSSCIPTYCKKNYAKILNRFPVAKLQSFCRFADIYTYLLTINYI